MEVGRIGLARVGSDVALVSVHGEHDLQTAPELRDRLADVISDGVGVVVDLSDSTFIDSSILGTLIDARREAQESELGFAVLLVDGGAEPVRRVLEVTGLADSLPLHSDRDAAIGQARDVGEGR